MGEAGLCDFVSIVWFWTQNSQLSQQESRLCRDQAAPARARRLPSAGPPRKLLCGGTLCPGADSPRHRPASQLGGRWPLAEAWAVLEGVGLRQLNLLPETLLEKEVAGLEGEVGRT